MENTWGKRKKKCQNFFNQFHEKESQKTHICAPPPLYLSLPNLKWWVLFSLLQQVVTLECCWRILRAIPSWKMCPWVRSLCLHACNSGRGTCMSAYMRWLREDCTALRQSVTKPGKKTQHVSSLCGRVNVKETFVPITPWKLIHTVEQMACVLWFWNSLWVA